MNDEMVGYLVEPAKKQEIAETRAVDRTARGARRGPPPVPGGQNRPGQRWASLDDHGGDARGPADTLVPDRLESPAKRLAAAGGGDLGATVSWFVANRLLGGPHGGTTARRSTHRGRADRSVPGPRRTAAAGDPVLAGIAVGVILGEVAIWLLGARSTAAVFVVILVAAGVSIAAKAPGVVRNQLTMSALFMVAVVPPDKELEPTRLRRADRWHHRVADHPGRRLTLAARAARHRGAAGVRGAVRGPGQDPAGLAATRREGRPGRADRARQLDSRTAALRRAVLVADENLRLAIWERRSRPRVQAARAAVDQVDYAVRNTRALARSEWCSPGCRIRRRSSSSPR